MKYNNKYLKIFCVIALLIAVFSAGFSMTEVFANPDYDYTEIYYDEDEEAETTESSETTETPETSSETPETSSETTVVPTERQPTSLPTNTNISKPHIKDDTPKTSEKGEYSKFVFCVALFAFGMSLILFSKDNKNGKN